MGKQSILYRVYSSYCRLSLRSQRTIITNYCHNAPPRLMFIASPSLLYLLHGPYYLAYNDSKQQCMDVTAAATQANPEGFHIPSFSLLRVTKEWLKFVKHQLLKLWYILARSTYLTILFTPATVTSPILLLVGSGSDWKTLRKIWWDLLRFTIRVSGPCNTKLCQWIATRPDLFPLEMVQELSLLQTKAYKHSWEESAAALQDGLGSEWRNMLDLSPSESPVVLGSGCIAS